MDTQAKKQSDALGYAMTDSMSIENWKNFIVKTVFLLIEINQDYIHSDPYYMEVMISLKGFYMAIQRAEIECQKDSIWLRITEFVLAIRTQVAPPNHY